MAKPPTESPTIPVYELPPPWPEEKLPEENGTRYFPIEKYWEISKDTNYSFDELDLNDDVCKKVVLSEIRKVPDIWCSRKNITAQSYWPVVAVGTFKRTGILLSIMSIKTIYKCAKDNLRNRLRFAVVKKRYSPKQVEKYMWGWDYYPFIRYFRKYTVKWEAGLMKERAALEGKDQLNEDDHEPDAKRMKTTRGDSECTEVSCESKEDDDIICDDPVSTIKPVLLEVKTESKDGLEEEPRSVVQNDGTHYKVNHTYYPPNTLFQTQDGRWTYEPTPRATGNVVKKEIPNQQYDEDIKHDIKPVVSVNRETSHEISIIDPVSSSTKTPSINVGFESNIESIALLARRVFGEHPECYKVIRRAIFETLLAFDDIEFASSKELYKYLYEKN
ncbi:hypothetical protein CAEBREN_03608 [Caenorhabditis brenneri]|uniref:Uncharacterized protein n=1 Tax=Caenorhabditis brenneri TaxID=135651 RepID=G0NZX7_CAEBE|nr:hypothetical protein CAEBREN_03608 [Caenorhabditis brenneri]